MCSDVVHNLVCPICYYITKRDNNRAREELRIDWANQFEKKWKQDTDEQSPVLAVYDLNENGNGTMHNNGDIVIHNNNAELVQPRATVVRMCDM
jgi:hypothetical protein